MTSQTTTLQVTNIPLALCLKWSVCLPPLDWLACVSLLVLSLSLSVSLLVTPLSFCHHVVFLLRFLTLFIPVCSLKINRQDILKQIASGDEIDVLKETDYMDPGVTKNLKLTDKNFNFLREQFKNVQQLRQGAGLFSIITLAVWIFWLFWHWIIIRIYQRTIRISRSATLATHRIVSHASATHPRTSLSLFLLVLTHLNITITCICACTAFSSTGTIKEVLKSTPIWLALFTQRTRGLKSWPFRVHHKMILGISLINSLKWSSELVKHQVTIFCCTFEQRQPKNTFVCP